MVKFVSYIFLPILLLFLANSVSAQLSPGDLTNAHANLEGISNCTQCHTVGKKVSRENCLNCHKEINSRISAKKGYHISKEVTAKECIECHNEHHGRTFKIVRLNKETFDHQLTGYELKGKHLTRDCAKCHTATHIKDPEIRKKPNTYLGLSQECISCHEDHHQGKMSANCSNCHGYETFKGATGFDHDKSRYPLTGLHKKVACEKCHKSEMVNGKLTQIFQGLAFANCNSCHTDVHKNKFGLDCKKCHTEESFHQVKGINTFDHDKTNYKLTGKHLTVNCKNCHKISLTTPVKHGACSDCHADYHKKEFSLNGKSPDCSECHNIDGFTPSLFTFEKHNQSKFKLDGAHMATPCFSCHKKQTSWSFRNVGIKCVDCHKNEHKGFIGEQFFPDESCTACHQTDSWKLVKFDHSQTKFKLEGVHQNTKCLACHYPGKENKLSSQKFTGLSTSCNECHANSHAGQFDVNGITDCTRCHGYENWTKSTFDHNSARFRVEGVHAKLACAKCHPEVTNSKGKYVEYKNNKLLCSDCHRSL